MSKRTMSARAKSDISITQHAAGKPTFVPDSAMNERNLTGPWLRVACSTPEGTQMARLGGATQVPASVVTETTPLVA